VSHSLARITAVVAVALAALVGFSKARSTLRPARARAAACSPRLSLVAHGQGSPDDLAWAGRTLLASDIHKGTIGVVAHGRVRTLVGHLHEPEGIVPGPGHSLIVAEQATNSVLEIKLPNGSRTTLAKLPLPSGQSGVDGINADGPAAVFVPDSARGRLYVLHLRSRKLSLVAGGMTRPVAAIHWGNAVAVADEYASAVWRIGQKRTRLAAVTLPDDLAVISHHLIAVSLIGEVWEVAPHRRMLSSAFSPTATDPQGLVADGADSVLVADQSRNAIYRLSRLSGCL
jgi:streptogramin lyase